MMTRFLTALLPLSFLVSCADSAAPEQAVLKDSLPVKPVLVTEKVYDDPDDPAIWINPADPAKSLVIGTDKHKVNGALYVFDMEGRIDSSRSVTGMQRMNNTDVAYGLNLAAGPTDIVVATERDKHVFRVFSLPGMKALDNGGIPVFTGDSLNLPMGIALYTRPADHAMYVIVGRKHGPLTGYLEQYLLQDNGQGGVSAKLVRKFGKYSGKKEIEAIAVDNENGFVYYSDEQAGIRKYYADPDKGNEELAFFGQHDFGEDNEGISFYKFPDGTGYILVSDQSRNRFNVYPREGTAGNLNRHPLLVSIPFSTIHSDGSELTSESLPGFPGGMFVAMSDNQTFEYYRWKDIADKAGLRSK